MARTWILDFELGTTFDDVPVTSGFVKLSIEPSTMAKGTADEIDRRESMTIARYESDIYEDVIRPLLDRQVCPNFVRFLTKAERCSYADLLRLLTIGLKEPQRNSASLTDSLHRDLLLLFDQNVPRPPPIHEEKATLAQTVANFADDGLRAIDPNWRFNFFVTEYHADLSFDAWMFERHGNDGPLDIITWRVILQVAIAAYAMALSRLVHNDLHLQNVLCQTLDPAPHVVYEVDGETYAMDVHVRPLVFDFDNAYAERLGENPAIKRRQSCENESRRDNQCNAWIGNKDAVQFLGMVYQKTHHKATRNALIRCAALDTDDARNFAEDVMNYGGFLTTSKGEILQTEHFARYFRPMPELIRRLGQMAKTKSVPKDARRDFRCSATRFAKDGRIHAER